MIDGKAQESIVHGCLEQDRCYGLYPQAPPISKGHDGGSAASHTALQALRVTGRADASASHATGQDLAAGSGRVMRIDVYVPACEVAGPEDGAAGAGGEVETDGDARGCEQGAQVVAVLDALAVADDGDVADAQGDAPGHEGDAGGAGGGEDATPVGVAAGEGGLDQRGVGDGAGDAIGGGLTDGTAHLDFHDAAGAFAVRDDVEGEGAADGAQGEDERTLAAAGLQEGAM